MSHQNESPFVSIWLKSIVLLIFTMIMLGGITRLTHSGLSMVEWRPLIGTLPPLNEQEWVRVFEKYQSSPEYQQINQGMNLHEFKKIFFWEYFHRLIGRLLALITALPFLFFLLSKKISHNLAIKVSLGFLIGGLQGLMGWIMVKSGLNDRPSVSHFRLAAHLSLASLLLVYFYRLHLFYKNHKLAAPIVGPLFPAKIQVLKKYILVFISLLFIQINFGALVAGLKAGFMYNTWPKIGLEWIPISQFIYPEWWHNLVSTAAGVQFLHRNLAYLIFIFALMIYYYGLKLNLTHQLKKLFHFFILIVSAQVLLGIITLLNVTPLHLAVTHQAMAFILLLLSIKIHSEMTSSLCPSS